MSHAVLCMSHSPLLEHAELSAEVSGELESAFADARGFVEDFDPELVISFAPDHYNGFFYDTMPPFCVGLAGYGLGDYGTATGPLDVPTDLAEDLARSVLAEDVDLTISRAMGLDHGAIQPLEILFGSIDAVPVVPVFVNGVAAPFGPVRRVRQLGEAVGRWAADREERVLVIGSGGLSHDPPVPQWATASPEARQLLLEGRNPTPEAQAARQQRVIDTARAFAAGEAPIRDLNPEWDARFMTACREHDTEWFDALVPDEMVVAAGNSAHETRTWVAAFSALGAVGPYAVTHEYYRPIPELIAGFGVMAATAV